MQATDQDGDDEAWTYVGRELLHSELAERRYAVSDAFQDAEDALAVIEDEEYVGELEAEDIRAMRRELNHARRIVEEYAARVADDVEPWGEPVPSMPYSVYRDVLGR